MRIWKKEKKSEERETNYVKELFSYSPRSRTNSANWRKIIFVMMERIEQVKFSKKNEVVHSK